MPLDRFLSASLAGSSVSLNFKNWHHRIYGNEGCQQLHQDNQRTAAQVGRPTSISSKLEGNLRSSKAAVWCRIHCKSSNTSSRYSCQRSCSSCEQGREQARIRILGSVLRPTFHPSWATHSHWPSLHPVRRAHGAWRHTGMKHR